MSNYLRKEVTQESKDRKVSFQNYIKKLIIIFFIIMLALTFISRAADSALVAKVTKTSAKKGELTFRFRGSGKITENAKQYLEIYEGVHISKILVKEGAKVEPGDPLFQYSIADLEKKYKEAKDEILRSELNYEKAKLSYEVMSAGAAVEAAELTLQRTKLDLTLAGRELQISKDRIKKQRRESCENAQKEYEAALAVCDKQEVKKNNAVKQASRELQKVEDARAELNEARIETEAVLSEYRVVVESLKENVEDIMSSISGKGADTNKDSFSYFNVDNRFFNLLTSLLANSGDTQAAVEQKDQQVMGDELSSVKQEEMDRIVKAVDNIFRNYYGEEEYKVHQKKIETAEQNLERKKEDYSCSIISAAENGRNLTVEDKLSYIRQYEDAIATLEELTGEDLKLREAIAAYGYALLKKEPVEIENTYTALFACIYRENKAETKEIEAADDEIETAREALADTTAEWKDTIAEAQEKAEELLVIYQKEAEVYQQMIDGTYDYSEEVWMEEKQVESAARAVTDAKISVEQANDIEYQAAEKNQKEEELHKLDYELYRMDLEERNEIADALNRLLKQDGMVTSPLNGYAVGIGVEEGSMTTGIEKVAIAVDECSIQIYVTKEEAKRIEKGDELMIKIGKREKSITVPISSIGAISEEGMVEITGTMPEGEYQVGTEVTYELTKKSKQYRQTIPITALHSDSYGNYYVLVPEERNTVLGNELIARRIAITLIDKNETTAAVDGDLYSIDIISGSNKNIEEGDRVRSIGE
ncbi:MAG TPA: hypothetical protein VJZ06_03220 [Mobilitalea sp.]|nr:hypothetical protein [Mobilitalea sp.]